MGFGSTQSLTKISITDIPWGKAGRRGSMNSLPPSCPEILAALTPANLRACPAQEKDCFTSARIWYKQTSKQGAACVLSK